MRSLLVPALLAAILGTLLALAPVASSASDPFLSLRWTPLAANPILTPGPAGAWDSMHVVGGPVLRVNGTYMMWYVGSADNLYWSTGLATSPDGVHWTKYAGNPVLPSAGGSSVLYENGTYRMWYSIDSPNAYAVPAPIHYATSTDGIHWTDVVNDSVLNVTAGAWDGYTLAPGPVIHNETGYWMWYAATADQMEWRPGLARSPDGIHWTKYAGNPIIVPPFAGSWDDFRVNPTAVLQINGELVLWYVSDDTNLVQRIGVAVSTDGTHWTPSSMPALDIGAPGTWDGGSLSHAAVVQTGQALTMWFTGLETGSGFTGHWQVGVAHAELEAHGESQGILGPPPSAVGAGALLLATAGGAGAGAGGYVAAVALRRRR